MTSICGLWSDAVNPVKGQEAMLAALPGCKTDLRGTWADASVAFGWRGRVLAEGEKTEHLLDAASGIAVTASARLDGRAALCESLGLPHPDGPPDSALILKSYSRWGQACPEHLLGDYAFAVWDAKQEVLFCARDHIGARPFYYALAGGRFVFASDVDAVLAAPGVSAELDEAAVATRLTYGSRSLGAHTSYRAVRRLLPGHALTVERGRVRTHRWWRPEETPLTAVVTDQTLAEACLALLSEAVRDRVRDRRSVGVHVSGGLDSSAVAVLAARELRGQGLPAPLAFAWHPPPGPGVLNAAEAAEYGRIEAVRRQEGLQVFYRSPEAADVVAFLRRDGTRGDDESTSIHEDVVQRAAAEQGVEVLLSGWGGDEGISFNGRCYYPQLLRSGQVARLWGEVRDRSRCPVAGVLTEAVLPLVSPGAAVWLKNVRRGGLPFRRLLLPKNATFIHPEFARRVRPLPAGAVVPRAGVREMQIHLLQDGHLHKRTEGWAASGAHHGIEYRYPLLDRRVLEFALGLPPQQYRRGRWSRWLMRRVLAPIVPPEVVWNTDDREPVRVNALKDAVAEALPVVRGMIEERGTPPRRGRYLDLLRLTAHLDAAAWRSNWRSAPVVNALRFLDF